MRVLLFTGKGGVGKTSLAAATAVTASKAGLKTLVMSTDPAHSLADAFGVHIGHEATEVGNLLLAEQIDAQLRLEENWREVQQYAVEFLTWAGMSSIHAEELTVIPGLDEIFSLADIKRHHDSGLYDLLVVDCAPTAETLRLLSLPEALAWYIDRLFPIERRIVGTLRPVFDRVRSLPPLAPDSVFTAVERFSKKLEGVRELLTDPATTSVRLVLNPERIVIAEARRTFTYLSLFGYRVDAVFANKMIPESVSDPYFFEWKRTQAEHMETINRAFAPLPVMKVRLFDKELVGVDELGRLGQEAYGDIDPSAVLFEDDIMRLDRSGADHLLQIKLPFASRDDVDLSRKGDELHVRIGNFKRNLVLPALLQHAVIGGARFDGDWLTVGFEGRDGASKRN